MSRYGVRLSVSASVRVSVPSCAAPRRAAGLLPSAVRAGDIDLQPWPPGAAAPQHGAQQQIQRAVPRL